LSIHFGTARQRREDLADEGWSRRVSLEEALARRNRVGDIFGHRFSDEVDGTHPTTSDAFATLSRLPRRPLNAQATRGAVPGRCHLIESSPTVTTPTAAAVWKDREPMDTAHRATAARLWRGCRALPSVWVGTAGGAGGRDTMGRDRGRADGPGVERRGASADPQSRTAGRANDPAIVPSRRLDRGSGRRRLISTRADSVAARAHRPQRGDIHR